MPKGEHAAISKAAYLERLEAGSSAVSGTASLRSLPRQIKRLTIHQKQGIVDQAIILLERFYVHLPMKRAMHAIDPLQRLRLLRRRLPQLTSEIAFHQEMSSIFISLRDLHTRYTLPSDFARLNAFLPFRVEAYVDGKRRRYIVSKVAKSDGPDFQESVLDDPDFKPGVEIEYWNGIPMARAVEIAAAYHAGSNEEARHARGLEGLTKRAMVVTPPPDEEWVRITYRTLRGERRELQVDWGLAELPGELASSSVELSGEAALGLGLDLEGDTLQRISKMLFLPKVVDQKRRIETVKSRPHALAAELDDDTLMSAVAAETPADEGMDGIPSTFPDIFLAKEVEKDGRRYGYLRIFSFMVGNPAGFVAEVIRLIGLLPQEGLIVDVRGNSGGVIMAAERLLQLFTPREVEPSRFQFIYSEASLALSERYPPVKKWGPSLQRALEAGAAFSTSFPLTSAEECNDIGQRYYGPVLLVTDARCYSATDIFAAGFKDNCVGKILGVDWRTGAGGANVWTLELINQSFQLAGLREPLRPLARNAGMRVAIRRTLRIGAEAGTELEDFGVTADFKHNLTRDDVLKDNVDLINAAGRLLADQPVYALSVEPNWDQGTFRCTATARNTASVEALCAGKFQGSKAVAEDRVAFEFPAAQGTVVELRGYDAEVKLVSQRLLKAGAV